MFVAHYIFYIFYFHAFCILGFFSVYLFGGGGMQVYVSVNYI